MRLIITENITLDGVIEAVDNWFGPEEGESDSSDILAEIQTMMRRQPGPRRPQLGRRRALPAGPPHGSTVIAATEALSRPLPAPVLMRRLARRLS